jgi:hypothetical protein
MPTQTITTTGAGNWPIPGDCPAGTVIAGEMWGAGAGASGRVGSTFGSAGAGGAYAADNYTVTPADIALGTIPYNIGAGSAGTSGADPAGGGDSTFGTIVNLLGNSSFVGGTTGAGGSAGTGYTWTTNGLTATVIGFGVDTSTGPSLDYVDVQFSGTTTSTTVGINTPAYASPPASIQTGSIYVALIGGTLPGTITGINFSIDTSTWTAFFANTGGFFSGTTTLTATLHQYTTSTTTVNTAGCTSSNMQWTLNVATATAYNFSLRFAGIQHQIGGSALAYQKTPGSYIQALGGSPPNALVGGPGARAAGVGSVTGIGRTHYFIGGNGAAYNAAGSGGGGSGGKDGVGVAGSIAGVGGQGDASTGGLGGAVKTTTPGNAGTANVEGGGGGGALTTVAGTGGAGAAPGGGAGSAVIATGTGGTGARGQGRLTYIANIGALIRPPPLQIWDH